METVLVALRLIEQRARGNDREQITLGDIEWAIQELEKERPPASPLIVSEEAVQVAGNAYWNRMREKDGLPKEPRPFKLDPDFADSMKHALIAAVPHLQAK